MGCSVGRSNVRTHLGRRVPNFVIVGAMKAGTTSLHHHLESHSDIEIPRPELVLFDLGEDSTTYLYNDHAPSRMREVLGEPRVVVMLRDPVARLLSQYWHQVNRRSMQQRLERALFADATLLQRSTYAPGLRRFIDEFGADSVHVVLTEDLAARPESTVNGVREFLGLPSAVVTPRTASNVGTYPTRAWPLLLRNRLWPDRSRPAGASEADLSSRATSRRSSAGTSLLGASVRLLGGAQTETPTVSASTLDYLSRVLTDANAGLDAILGRDLAPFWPSWRTAGAGQSDPVAVPS